MTNMRVHTMAAIRNARGLTPEEKVMLYTIESRGEAFSKAGTLQDDCGMGRNRFYRTRKACVDRGLVAVKERRPRGTTVYRVNHEAVAALEPGGTPGSDIATNDTDVTSDRDIGTRDTIVTPARQINVIPAGDANVTSQGDTKRTLKGSPQGDPQRGRFRRTAYGVIRTLGEPVYVRAVRAEELNAWDRVKFDIDSMSESERAEWSALLEAEEDLP